MTDPVWVYWRTTGLTPEKLHVQSEKTGEVGEIDYKTSLREAALKRAKRVSFAATVPTFEGTDGIDARQRPEVEDLAKFNKPFLIRREPRI